MSVVSLDAAAFDDDVVHESAKHALAQRQKYARWLDSDNDVVVANALLIMIGRALNMLNRQIEAQGEAFEKNGGFSERLTARRVAARGEAKGPAPDCPQCGKTMRRRTSAKGDFWGCAAYPACRGTRQIEQEALGETRLT